MGVIRSQLFFGNIQRLLVIRTRPRQVALGLLTDDLLDPVLQQKSGELDRRFGFVFGLHLSPAWCYQIVIIVEKSLLAVKISI